jgi:hypothetical protein
VPFAEVAMVGTVALSGISLLAIGFLGVFLAAICREKRHRKICVLLRQEAGSVPDASAFDVPKPDAASAPAKFTIVSRRRQKSIAPMHRPNSRLKAS